MTVWQFIKFSVFPWFFLSNLFLTFLDTLTLPFVGWFFHFFIRTSPWQFDSCSKTAYLLAIYCQTPILTVVDTLTVDIDSCRFDSLFFASIKIKQASIPHDRRRKLVIFKMKLKKFNLSYLEVLAFSEKICYNRKREKNAVLLRTVPHLIQRLLVLRKPCCRLFTVLFCYPNYNTVNSFCQGFFLFLWVLRLYK